MQPCGFLLCDYAFINTLNYSLLLVCLSLNFKIPGYFLSVFVHIELKFLYLNFQCLMLCNSPFQPALIYRLCLGKNLCLCGPNKFLEQNIKSTLSLLLCIGEIRSLRLRKVKKIFAKVYVALLCQGLEFKFLYYQSTILYFLLHHSFVYVLAFLIKKR